MIIKNNPNVSNWEWEKGYLDASMESDYPFRITESGPDFGLKLSLIVHEQDYTSMCAYNEDEFYMFLTVPTETRDLNPTTFHIPISTDSLISIEAQLNVISNSIRNWNINKRNCAYGSDHPLTYFKSYSTTNCLKECLSNLTAKTCDCVPYFMPRM